MKNSLLNNFGDIDIYLFDQLLKDRFKHCKTILDVGCGNGRNLVYFLQNNFEVFGIDQNPASIEEVRKISLQLAPGNSLENFSVAHVEAMPFRDAAFDIVVCNAVLHFAKDENHFDIERGVEQPSSRTRQQQSRAGDCINPESPPHQRIQPL